MKTRPGLDELVADIVALFTETHAPEVTSYDAGDLWGCECGWRPPGMGSDNDWALFRAHQSEHLAAYLDTRLGEEPL